MTVTDDEQLETVMAQRTVSVTAGLESWKGSLLALVAIVSVQLLVFLPIVSRVGYYLDDWATLAYLHFAPKESLLAYLGYYFMNDGRVLIRPVEVLHFGLMQWYFPDSAFAQHLLNLGFESASAFLSFLILRRLTGISSFSLAASLLFLLHPGHDSTHYWVICASVGLSIMLYLGSLYAAIRATDSENSSGKKSYLWLALSLLLFTTGLFNYETILPLCAMTVMIVFALYLPHKGLKKSLFSSLPHALVSVLAVVSLLLYLKVGVGLLGKGYDHAVTLEPSLMFNTIVGGLNLNLGAAPWQFYFAQAQAALLGFSSSERVRLTGALLITALVLALMRWKEPSQTIRPRISVVALLVVALISMVASYSIFGISRDYAPTLVTLVNRINAGAACISALIFFAFFYGLDYLLRGRKLLQTLGFSLVSLSLVALYVLADWGQAKAWMVSWQTQSHIQRIVKDLHGSHALPQDASLLLVNCPRYVMCAPVFDGVWDFQNMVRIITGNEKASANVVSERLTMGKENIADVSYGYECGKYPYKQLYLLLAPSGRLVHSPNAATFIEVVEKNGRQFGLDDNVFKGWREQAAGSQ